MSIERKFIWIATPVLMRGKQIVATLKELEALGFDRSNTVKCAKGKRTMHNNHIIKNEPRTISRKALEKSCGLEVLRALELGLRPSSRTYLQHPIAAKNLETGKVTIFHSPDEIRAAGFLNPNVSMVINGKRKHHKNHIFYRVAPDVWNTKEFDDE